MSDTSDKRAKNTHAQRMFDGIAPSYEWPAELFSFLQYGRWRASLLTHIEVAPAANVLDVCTGTGLVALDIAERLGCRVVGLDLSRGMIEQARRNIASKDAHSSVPLIQGCAERLPFADGSFDAVVFTFLLRYVESPESTLGELARVLKPGGQIASLEFFVPPNPIMRALWLLHTRLAMPVMSRLMPGSWGEVGSFLGPNISDFCRRYSRQDLSDIWMQAGIDKIQTGLLSFGGAMVTWGMKGGPA
jgi:demethylmenaquinone methyltransferase/2-methoxy-6-polyprenyl-1,4-benzoquinol methylase